MAADTTPANILLVSSRYELVNITKPRPLSAPVNSLTIAPTTDRGDAARRETWLIHGNNPSAF